MVLYFCDVITFRAFFKYFEQDLFNYIFVLQ